ncbi:uncharacterized protein CYBJADRAFT_31171 [Cyberlindnera jadinii NRRL Y-1542]|uniref:Uncharacterized protein n=1 Tax=Cyberlindnera jadinii (strain ATCC 18201 / CBS 1600 / BCRC 20928 / JCM 3617 / NBRC 0987 / NRRL Y-1542) TaxID=983966 RepID=A0A1E4RWN5_CYBJN|nr:hypothetical protein CYBJADRAFT_31171 [Cyberlindnera jadinii NRRL Y-1542]ODV71495.1 hypothetical protein CYBJADRAFT_31171 [Cyberlindnera jadinii NRRL Y-1542]
MTRYSSRKYSLITVEPVSFYICWLACLIRFCIMNQWEFVQIYMHCVQFGRWRLDVEELIRDRYSHYGP